MCGRFALTVSPEELEANFGLAGLDAFPPRYNIAPTQPILLVMTGETPPPGSNRPDRKALLARWGFMPAWVKDPASYPLMINARAETAAEKSSFRTAMRHHRALIPASGFYEWRRDGNRKLQAYWIRPRHGGIVAFGALMETWSDRFGSEMDTGCILTTAANDTLRAIHDRMPVVIQPEEYARWLDCKTQEPRHVADLLRPVQADFFEAIPVSDKVNKVSNLGPELQDRQDADEPPVSRKPRKTDPPDTPDDQMSLF
ncbi:MAG: SOS response-associated peptidase [Phyllobacterium sp.]